MYKFQPAFGGEIKENSLRGIADTTAVLINGKVSNYEWAAENLELIFINQEIDKTFKTITDFNGDFKINIVNGLYRLQLKNQEFGSSKILTFEDLKFKSGEIRELKIYTESSAETVVVDTIFENKRAYKRYLKRQ